jgi:hypothetical protein
VVVRRRDRTVLLAMVAVRSRAALALAGPVRRSPDPVGPRLNVRRVACLTEVPVRRPRAALTDTGRAARCGLVEVVVPSVRRVRPGSQVARKLGATVPFGRRRQTARATVRATRAPQATEAAPVRRRVQVMVVRVASPADSTLEQSGRSAGGPRAIEPVGLRLLARNRIGRRAGSGGRRRTAPTPAIRPSVRSASRTGQTSRTPQGRQPVGMMLGLVPPVGARPVPRGLARMIVPVIGELDGRRIERVSAPAAAGRGLVDLAAGQAGRPVSSDSMRRLSVRAQRAEAQVHRVGALSPMFDRFGRAKPRL